MFRMTVTISPQLETALSIMATEARVSRSRLVETLLRENEHVQKMFAEMDKEPDVTEYVAPRRTVRDPAAIRAVIRAGTPRDAPEPKSGSGSERESERAPAE